MSTFVKDNPTFIGLSGFGGNFSELICNGSKDGRFNESTPVVPYFVSR